MKTLSIGQSAYTITVQTEKEVPEGSSIEVNDAYEAGGGSTPIVAYTLGKYKNDSYIGSVVGDDSYGSSLKKELESVGVHTEYMETAYEKSTTLEFILLNKTTKNKTVYSVTKEALALKKGEFQVDPDLVFVDGYDYGSSVSALNKYAGAIKVINAERCNKEIYELAKYCDYIIATKEFAEWMTGIRIDFDNPGSLVQVYSEMIKKLVKKVIVVTLGEKGALYMKDNQIKVMPGLKLECVDTTGAGDIFKGAFCHALLQKYDIEQCVTFANIAGGLSVQKIGAFDSVPDISDIMTYYNQKYGATAPANPTAAPTTNENPAPQTGAPVTGTNETVSPANQNPAGTPPQA